MSSRKIEDLHYTLQKIACDLITNLKREGIDIIITCTWRSPTEQQILYNQGRSAPGYIVTHAQAGESKHNFILNDRPASLAFDVVPIVNGKPYWTTNGAGFKLWQAIGAEGKLLGLDWAGDWPEAKREYAHFQLNKEEIRNVENHRTAT